MCPYITQRVNEGRKWKAVLAVIGCLFGILMLISAVMALKQREYAAAVFAVVFAALTIWPGIAYFNRSLERSIAHDFGLTLEGVKGDRISYGELKKICGGSDTISSLEKLLKKGYLRNIAMDAASRTILLTDRRGATA